MIPRIVSLSMHDYSNYSSDQHRIGWEEHRIKLVYVEKQDARRVRLVHLKCMQMSIPAALSLSLSPSLSLSLSLPLSLPLSLTLEKTDIDQVHEHRVLGVTVDAEMKWQSHPSNVC